MYIACFLPTIRIYDGIGGRTGSAESSDSRGRKATTKVSDLFLILFLSCRFPLAVHFRGERLAMGSVESMGIWDGGLGISTLQNDTQLDS